ncbi:uncharacterized protein LOC143377237 [Andrena cerasifolii]|uniref:uncharacterized protein LOC143377237 n=1 Tax=Andrena cerasifolii TaxID=2819439 RepID=UPI0040378196
MARTIHYHQISITQLRHSKGQSEIMMTLLPILLLLSGVSGNEIQSPVTVTRFERTPNLYLDAISPTNLYHRQWKTVVYVDLREVQQTELQIAQTLHHPLFTQAGPQSTSVLTDIINRFKRTLVQRDTLLTCLGYSKPISLERNTRRKRGILNRIGELSNILFGTLVER